MPDWLTYSPSDFLLFSARTYQRLFILHNEALWPLHIAALMTGLGLIVCVWRPGPASQRLIPAILAVTWAWVAWSFLWQRYATINWAANYAAWIFIIQAAMLAAFALPRYGLRLAGPGGAWWDGHIVLLLAIVLIYPLLPWIVGRNWRAGELFAIAPDPTVLVTLAILSLSTCRWKWLLLPIPAAWCAFSGLTLWALYGSG